jgi:hypothetical protein
VFYRWLAVNGLTAIMLVLISLAVGIFGYHALDLAASMRSTPAWR